MIFFITAKAKQNKEIEKKPHYKYYSKAIIFRLLLATIFCFIYWEYYGGGDSIGYFLGAFGIQKILINDFSGYFYILFNEPDGIAWSKFMDADAFIEAYMFRDPRTYLVIKLTSIIGIFGFGGFLATTLFVSRFTFSFVWELFELLVTKFPNHHREIAWSLIFLPSVVFWGAGIMKDTYTFVASCGLFVCIDRIFIQRKKVLISIISTIIFAYVILNIKSYILYAFIPSLLIYVNFERLKKIKSTTAKLLLLPIGIGLSLFSISFFFTNIADQSEVISSEDLIRKAVVQQEDLKRDFYGRNFFDIGEFDATPTGILKTAPIAISAALFRPFIWEVGSPTMLFSGIENLGIGILFIFLIIKKGPIKFFKTISSSSFIQFCLIYSLILGFMVGFSTANFGALVRYRIPMLPFFVFMLLYILFEEKKIKN